MDVIFLDKEETLGSYFNAAFKLYSGVREFLEVQSGRNRKKCVATTAVGDRWKSHLAPIEELLDGYFGAKEINSADNKFYLFPNMSPRNIRNDYVLRINIAPNRKELDGKYKLMLKQRDWFSGGDKEREELNAKIAQFFSYWHELVHKETGQPFDESSLYRNPHSDDGFYKDLFLARRLVSPTNYRDLRTIMVGDHKDVSAASSDPETPLIVISDQVRLGQWGIVSTMLDKLFSDAIMKPWQVYDVLGTGALHADSKTVSIDGLAFNLERTGCNGRVIYCP